MNINRHNYEEFFLLYVDNELNDEQRKAVEIFAAQHPDLEQELVMLQEAVLPAEETVTFFDKDRLIKKESGINLVNYQEYFLLSVDNELAIEEKEAVERFVLQNPKLQDEFTLLKQTKLPVEVVECTFKESLYREEKVRRIIPVYWSRIAVAAAITGLAVLLWTIIPQGSASMDTELANTEIKNTVPETQIKNQIAERATEEKGAENNQPSPDKITKVESLLVSTNRAEAKNSATKVEPSRDAKEDEPKELMAISNPVFKEEKQSTPIEIIDRSITSSSTETTSSFATTKANAEASKSLYQTAASYTNSDEEEEDNTILIAGGEFNKKKVLGLLKKATNLFDKKQNKSESDRTIQIASFEIKTK